MIEDEDDPPMMRWEEPERLPHGQGGAFTIEGGAIVLRLSGVRKSDRGGPTRWRREFVVPLAQAELEHVAIAGRVTLRRKGRPVQEVTGVRWGAWRRFRAAFDDAQSVALEPKGRAE